MALSKTTQDHDEIRRWTEERGGKPAHVRSTESKEDIGILRLEFPGFGEESSSLEEISWDDFFEKFDDRKLALIYQEETADGERSNFNKLVSAETAAEADNKSKRSNTRSRGAKKSAPAKKAVAKKAATTSSKTAKKSAPPAKKAVKKTASKSAVPAKKAAKRVPPPPAKKAVAKKAVAKKAMVKKAVAKKVAAKKVPAKKAAAKKVAAKKGASKRR